MKKIISIMLALAMLLGIFVSCGDNTESSSSSSVESSSSSEESSSQSQSSFTESSSSESSSAESSSEAQSSSSSSSSSSEEESEESTTDPADIVDPDAPENETLNLFVDGESDYVVYYDTDDSELEKYVTQFLNYVKTEYGIQLETRNIFGSGTEHKIIFGSGAGDAQYVTKRLYTVNDFAISVCGDDLVIYATDYRLYPYALDLFGELFDGENGQMTPEQSIIYHKSEYKDIAYAGYLDKKLGNISYETLVNTLFEPRTYKAKDNTTIPYRIYIPSNYDPENPPPVVTILHGAGERGNDNARQLLNFVPNIFSQDNSPYWNAIVICPQCPGGNQWVDTSWSIGNYSTATVKQSNEITAVLEILGEIKKEFETDTNRYYVAGLSMGGYGTWDIIMRHPDLFAGAIAMCGGADESMAKMLVEKRFPVYALHGGSDSVVKYQGTKSMIDAMTEACTELGLDPVHKFKPLAGYDHNIWEYTGNMATYSKWLFEQTLEDRK